MFAAIILAATVDLSAELKSRIDAAHLPAMQATVVTRDGIVAHGAAGITKLGATDAVTNADAFHIGSCTKPFTATILGMLVEEKRIGWETRVAEVFPEWKIRSDYAAVTLADLLSHEAGLPPYGEEEEMAKLPPLKGTATERRSGFAQFVLSQPPAIPPRTQFQYSNAGYIVAAAIAEKVAKRSWEDLVRTRIFDPLHMTSAGIGWPARVWGHEEAMGALKPVDPHGMYQLQDFLAPAGDLHMTSDDLAAFLRAHLRAMNGEKTLISPATAAVMHAKRKKSGLGFGVATVAGFEDVATHSGSADTFVTVIAIAPHDNVAVAVSTNAAGDTATKAVGAELKDLLTRFARRDRNEAPR
ncbi:MAG TPA: serine hydrolase domain-containing protein [Thermoanaerobaculia bacterium]